MGHNVGKQAALAVAAGQKRGAAVAETRTSDEIIKTLRGNLNSPVTIMKTDIAILMAAYDTVQAQYQAAVQIITARNHEIAAMQEQVDRFREVYDMENRVQKVEFSPEGAAQLAAEAQETGSES
jgi:hypothetical protein